MKPMLCLLCTLLLAVLPPARADAADGVYTESFADVADNEIRRFVGMSMQEWASYERSPLPGIQRTGAAAQTGSVIFQVSGAQEIAVRVVTRQGSFLAEEGGQVHIGPAPGGSNALSAMETLRRDPLDGLVYGRVQGVWNQVVLGSRGQLTLTPEDPHSEGRLVDFGVNLYASAGADGPETRLSMQRTAMNYLYPNEIVHVEETFELAGSLPADTAFVRIELNDLNTDTMADPAASRTSIAWVRFAGSDLVMGEPEDPGDGGDDDDDDGDDDGDDDDDDDGGQDGGAGGGSSIHITYEGDSITRIYRGEPQSGTPASPGGGAAAAENGAAAADQPHIYRYELSEQDRALLARLDSMALAELLAMLGLHEAEAEALHAPEAEPAAAREYHLIEDPEIYAIPLQSGAEDWVDRAALGYVAAVSAFLVVTLIRGRGKPGG